MDFSEALKLMKQGKKVRRPHWIIPAHLCVEEDRLGFGNVRPLAILQSTLLSSADLLATDYEVLSTVHSFEEALKAWKNGKTIRRESWASTSTFSQDFGRLLACHDLKATDWLIEDE